MSTQKKLSRSESKSHISRLEDERLTNWATATSDLMALGKNKKMGGGGGRGAYMQKVIL